MAMEIALPYRSDWREMASVLDYCKGKGADRAALEARFGAGESLRETLNALEQLGLVERGDGWDVRLTVLGDQLAYAPDQARLRERLVELLLRYPPYRFPLERALADGQPVLDGPWVEHIWQVDMRLGQPRNRVEEARTFFYRIADDAGLGTYRRGVRGQTTRLELDRDFAAIISSALNRLAAEQPAPAAIAAGDRDHGSPPSSPAVRPIPPSVGEAPAVADAWPLSISAPPVSATANGVLPGLPAGFNVQVDMTEWEIDRIADFLRLIGYLPND